MSIERLRKEIDALDDILIPLLEKRLTLVLALIDKKPALTDRMREEKILSKITSPYIQEIYKALFEQSKALLKNNGFSHIYRT